MIEGSVTAIFDELLDKKSYIAVQSNNFLQKKFDRKASLGSLTGDICEKISQYNIYCDKAVDEIHFGLRLGEHRQIDDNGFGLRHIIKDIKN